MDLSKIFNYLFAVYPGSMNWDFWRLVLIGAALSLAVAIFGIVMRKRNDPFLTRLGSYLTSWGFTVVVVIGLLFSFRYQNIYWLGMRFFIFFWLAVAIIWLLFILKWWFLTVPKKRTLRQKNQQFNQFLPKRR